MDAVVAVDNQLAGVDDQVQQMIDEVKRLSSNIIGAVEPYPSFQGTNLVFQGWLVCSHAKLRASNKTSGVPRAGPNLGQHVPTLSYEYKQHRNLRNR